MSNGRKWIYMYSISKSPVSNTSTSVGMEWKHILEHSTGYTFEASLVPVTTPIVNCVFSVCTTRVITLNRKSSWCQLFHHWGHRWLSYRHAVMLVTTKLAPWQLPIFSAAPLAPNLVVMHVFSVYTTRVITAADWSCWIFFHVPSAERMEADQKDSPSRAGIYSKPAITEP